MFQTQSLTRTLLPIIAFVVLYAVIGQFVTNAYFQLVLTLVPVWAIFGVSWNMLSGTTGLISFGHAAFFGLGCYTVALGSRCSASRRGWASRSPRWWAAWLGC